MTECSEPEVIQLTKCQTSIKSFSESNDGLDDVKTLHPIVRAGLCENLHTVDPLSQKKLI